MLEPITLGGALPLRNRICMGALTRNRCIDGKPVDATVRYYADRARDGVGMIAVEATLISPHGVEWPNAPMLTDENHVKAWRKVTDAVHHEGGKIFFQPWHAGRIQNDNMPMLKETGYPVYAPSKVKAPGGNADVRLQGHTENITEIDDASAAEIIEQYRRSVQLAKEAGFDGVELLAQGGYLIHSFLIAHANKRTDRYGGSVENRCRFSLEVIDAILSEWKSGHVGIKICPTDDYNDSMVPVDEMNETYDYLIRQLMSRELGYINLSRRGIELDRNQDDFWKSGPRSKGYELPAGYDPVRAFTPLIKYPGSKTMLMANHEYTPEEAEEIRKGIPFAGNDRGKTVNYGPVQYIDENYNDWPFAEQQSS
ncbi:hypothetical protein BDV36DRAFT_288811 [Aspergillus pseudocaelatus]|uniref:NADH:flavin oxidoreductase/NADH oxidase N-terminal domain-containing protein n=1 Tax=Aspergillus pseudocaelatus TaxID=1825620 RepID=A0ABQ6W2K5_9EURO|nr:hypothetical protein BDV36DRAFT_288811 [Aspergillus pseudocaelatus]